MFLCLSLNTQDGAAVIFQKRCAPCHGEVGDKRFLLLAKKLQKSRISDSLIQVTIRNGRMLMPSYKDKLTRQEIDDMVQYVKKMRKE